MSLLIINMSYERNNLFDNFIFSFECEFHVMKSIFNIKGKSPSSFIFAMNSNSTMSDDMFLDFDINIFTLRYNYFHILTNLIIKSNYESSQQRKYMLISDSVQNFKLLNSSFININTDQVNSFHYIVNKFFFFQVVFSQ